MRAQQSMTPAIFMDRDGTVSYEVGYVNHPDRYEIMPGSAEAIAKINSSGFLAIVITNQAGVARGYFKEELVGIVHEKLKRYLADKSAHLDGIYYCPHHPDVGEPPYRQRCTCRKPEPGMIFQAQKDLDIDLSGSYIIGDSIKDIETGIRAGVKGILLMTGYGRGEYEYSSALWKVRPIHIAENLSEAVDWILEREAHEM